MWLTHGPLSSPEGMVAGCVRACVWFILGPPNTVLQRLAHAQTAKVLAGPTLSADEVTEVGMEPNVKSHHWWHQRHQTQILAWTRQRSTSTCEPAPKQEDSTCVGFRPRGIAGGTESKKKPGLDIEVSHFGKCHLKVGERCPVGYRPHDFR